MNNQSYSLTKTQKRVWFNSKLSEKAIPNIVMVFELTGQLDTWVLRKSLENLVDENSVLKSTIYSSADHLERIINPAVRGNLEMADLTQSGQKTDVFWLLQNIASMRFNLNTGPLFHFHLLKVAENHFYFTILVHPIIVDRYSLKYLVEEISRHYNSIIQNKENSQREELFDFNKIVELEKKFNASEQCRQGLTHWTHTLKTSQFNLELPRKGYFPSQEYADSPFFEIHLDTHLRQTIIDFAKQYQVDYAVVLLAAYQVLLYKYTGNYDVIINYSSAVTYNEKKVFGCLENRLPLRVVLNDQLSFVELIQLSKTQLLYDNFYKDIQINDIVKAVRDKYDSHFSGIFSNTSFDYNYLPYEQLCLDSVKSTLIPKFMKKFVSENLAMYYHDNGTTISLIADFDEQLDSTAVKNFMNHYETLLTACLQESGQPVTSHGILTKDEYQKIMIDWNKTDEAYPHDFAHHLFEKRVQQNPDAMAVHYQDQQLTYAELNNKANQLAHYIRKKLEASNTQTTDKLVGICLNRGLDMVISMIAILKAGAAYVPLDPTYPEDRLVYILDDTQIKIIISENAVLNKAAYLANKNRHIICIDSEAEKIRRESQENLNVSLAFSNLAYIIYTSGSTGVPKGVMIEHRSFPNLIYCWGKYFQLGLNKRVLQFSSMNFDVVIPEIFSTLAHGAAIYVVPEDIRQSSEKLIHFLETKSITTGLLPPALLRILPRRHLPALETLAFGGDVCDQETVDYWSKGRRFINGYGPTECTVCATYGILQPGDLNNRLGRPSPNYHAYVLDKQLTPVPVGSMGELYIGGIGLGRGYVNRAEMTAERFICHPFGEGKLYKTGDVVRYMPDSHLEYIGRADFEVKIRGFRIQLADIEHVLQLLPGVKQVTTKIWQKPGLEKVIAAYYVLKNGVSITTRELRDHLQKKLPDYMVPGYLIEMDQIPVSVNGKINKALLPDPFPQLSSGKIENQEEHILKEIWTDLFKLSTEVVTGHSDFFDLGGHSLLATQLASRIKDRMKVEITIKDIFQNSQLKQIAKVIRESQQTEERQFVLEKAPQKELYLPSFSQMRFWFYYKINPQSTAYNILFSAKFSENVDVLALRKALIKLFTSHTIFKTIFVENEGEVYLNIQEKMICDIPLIDCETKEDIQTEIDNEKNHIFDLTALPLFRCKLLLSDSCGVTLLFNVHHIIFDGGSLSVMMNQLGEIYRHIIQHQHAETVSNSLDYHDFAYSQLKWKEKGLFDQQLAYWQRKLHLPLPVLELPTDFKRPLIASDKGDCIRFDLPENLVMAARKVAARNKSSLFSLLLSVYSILLQRLTHQNDLIIASPIANRNQQELENVIGMVANVVTYRTLFTEDMTFDDLLQAVNQDVIETQENQELPFDMIVNQVQAGRDTSRNPIFQTLFVLQSGFKLSSDLASTDVSYQITEEHTHTAKFDMTLSLYDHSSENAISGYFEFNTDLFRRDSVSRYLHYFITILRTVTENSQRTIVNIPLLESDEYRAIVHDSNQTEKEIPPSSIHRVFENRVNTSIDQMAVVYEEEKISYDLLNRKSNQLANYIRQQYPLIMQRELTGDVFIGLCMDRGIEMVISLLAILKAGAAFLPLDPHYPEERLNYILENSATHFILTQKGLANKLRFLQEENRYLICIDSAKSEIEEQNDNNLEIEIKPTDLAYIIYTSGSTGRPKGVMIEHKSVVNLVDAGRDAFDISSTDHMLQFASMNFDAAVFEIFQTLLNGATLFVAPEKVRIDTDELIKYLLTHRISYAVLPPALLRVLPQQDLPALKKLCFGGDVCDQDTVNYWMQNRDFYNLYGPTEITVCATYAKLTAGDSANRIGKALNNYTLYVLDKNLCPVPLGVLGELYVGGMGLARGYLNRPDLTVERFIVNPFSDNPSERLYKTGDIVRWRTVGELEYVGRSDFQVQIRGFRVELGEIEEMLNQHPAIKQAAVTTVGDDINKKIIAYYVLHDDHESPCAETLRKFLQNKLPDYMIPGTLIAIDTMPLSPSGKIDKQALPKMDENNLTVQHNYLAPRNEIEIALVQIWSELFNHQKIGIRDDFFSLGGNSLLTIRMLAKVKSQFNIHITLTQFFQHPTIESIAERVIGKETRMALDQMALAEADANLQLINRPVIYPDQMALKHILLTGANGFLGVFLLQELLIHTSAEIHCVVRGKNVNELQSKMQKACDKFGLPDLLNNPRVNLIKGELSAHQIGIEDETWKFLTEHCDAIYHNGSLVNHIYTYTMLKSANVGSTIELIQLATTGKPKLMNYISTISAATEFNAAGAALETGPSYKAMAASGYQLSKWVSECILTSAADYGLRINIFRPGNITGDVKNGTTNFENNNLLLLLKSCIELGVAPDWETHLEMIPVDVISHAIIQLSLQKNITQHVFNMANHHTIQWRDYFKWVNASGYYLKLIPPKEWFDAYLPYLSEDNALYPLRELYLAYPDLSIKGPEFLFENSQSRQLLEELKIFYPNNYDSLATIYFTYLKNKGFLPVKQEVA